MKNLILAIQFLTRIPINVNIETKENSFAESVIWFPAAGLLIGTFNAMIYLLSSMLLDGIFPVVCTVLANVCITGGLHVDGLADTCDGIFSARKKERMLEIMKDSRIGTNGTLAVVFDMLIRIAILVSIPSVYTIWVVFAAPIVSKSMLPLIMKLSVYARAEGGMGGLFLGKQTWSRTLAAFAAGFLITWGALKFIGLVSFAAALLAVILFKSYIYSKLQGMTGDTIGAANEIAEVVFLLALAIVWRLL
ncbi:MAG: cobalamin 5'-phosphate synthase [Clostridiales bacterium GWB2_37_7]|nr:MAG: cobalamin 5'-phosphate synthase [Clostridiales bacterium GWB2_37_7]